MVGVFRILREQVLPLPLQGRVPGQKSAQTSAHKSACMCSQSHISPLCVLDCAPKLVFALLCALACAPNLVYALSCALVCATFIVFVLL